MATASKLQQESLFLPIPEAPDARLHVRHIHRGKAGVPVFLLHGAIEDSRVFCSGSGKGLAPFLTTRGFECYAADLRGRGKSLPKISRKADYGQTESITQDLPAFARFMNERHPGRKAHWVAHSWGGVLILSFLARFPEFRDQIATLVFFGTKRSIHVFNIEKFLKIDLFWQRGAGLLSRLAGYLPAKELGLGADNETRKSLAQSQAWVRPSPWTDPQDGFDYATAIRRTDLPAALFLAGAGDRCLGHPEDVKDLIAESGHRQAEFRLLSREEGNLHDYGHIDMLTHPDAADDHFPWVADWMKRRDNP